MALGPVPVTLLELRVELLEARLLLLVEDFPNARVRLLAMLTEGLALTLTIAALVAQRLELGVLLGEDSADLLGLFGRQIELLLELGEVLLGIVVPHAILGHGRVRGQDQDREQAGPHGDPPRSVDAVSMHRFPS
jgi:hypothetical protein